MNLCDRRLELPPDFAQTMDPEVLTEDVPDLKRLSSGTRIINSVANFVRRHNCREILLALPWGDTSHIEFVRDQIKVLPVAVRLLPDAQVRSLTNFRSSARQRVLAIEIQRAPLSGAQRFVKRIMDIFVGALALVFFLPLMVLTAIAIKPDGPGTGNFSAESKGIQRQGICHIQISNYDGPGEWTSRCTGDP